jgi:hypothetical protein
MGYTRLDRDSNVVRHDSRLEHAWCRYNKSNSLRGKREEGVRNIIIRALGIHFLGAETYNLKSSKINLMGQPELFVDAYHQTYDLQLFVFI